VSRAAVAPRDVERTIERLTAAARVVRAGDVLVSPRVVANLRDRLLAELRAHHQASRLSEGVPREELRDRLFRRASAAVFAQVLDTLAAEGRVVARERVARRPSYSCRRPSRRAIIDATPVTLADAARRREGAAPACRRSRRRVIGLMLHKVLVRPRRCFTRRRRAAQARRRPQDAAPPRIGVAGFKHRYGITRSAPFRRYSIANMSRAGWETSG
jgi:hypothetical protein